MSGALPKGPEPEGSGKSGEESPEGMPQRGGRTAGDGRKCDATVDAKGNSDRARYIDGANRADGAEELAVETKDVIGWTVTGGLGLISLYLNWCTRRDAIRRKSEEADLKWSIRFAHRDDHPPFRLMELVYRDPIDAPVIVHTIKAKRPNGARLAKYNYAKDYNGRWGKDEPPMLDVGQSIAVDRELTGYVIGHGQTDRASLIFYLAFPSRPAFARSEKSAASITLTFSDISRTRRMRTLKITTPPIHWATTSADSAT